MSAYDLAYAAYYANEEANSESYSTTAAYAEVRKAEALVAARAADKAVVDKADADARATLIAALAVAKATHVKYIAAASAAKATRAIADIALRKTPDASAEGWLRSIRHVYPQTARMLEHFIEGFY